MRKKILTILMMLIMVTSFTNVNAISSDEVLYNHEGQDEEVTESLNELYDDLNICYSTGDATANQILLCSRAYCKWNNT